MRFLYLSLLLFISSSVIAQRIDWNPINDNRVPDGISFFSGTQSSGQAVKAWYIEIPANHPDFEVVPVKAKYGTASVDQISSQYDAIFTLNGGFFGGDVSVSTLITYNEVIERNIAALNRNGVTLPVIRSAAVWRADNTNSIEYVYHRNGTPTGFWRFDEPLPYLEGATQPITVNFEQEGAQNISGLTHSIGGGPVLLKDSTLQITYNEEVFWGSGVGKDNADPRSALGFKSDGSVILLVVDGRQSSSFGMGLTEVARELLALGCTEAINLDGGGSSQMAFDGEMVNRPVGSSVYRKVVTALAVVPKGSLAPDTTTTSSELIYDSEEGYSMGGWFETANSGFYGTTPSLLHPTTSANVDTAYFVYKFEDITPGFYTVDLWWVSSFNRSERTPIDIYYAGEAKQTLFVNQVQNNAQWVRLTPGVFPEQPMNSFYFSGDGTDSLVIRANTGELDRYVVSDALRLNFISTTNVNDHSSTLPSSFAIKSIYPNPFNPSTQLSIQITSPGRLQFDIYNTMGRKVLSLTPKALVAGTHQEVFDFSKLPSGIYFIKATFSTPSSTTVETAKVSLVR